jgi:chemotaxis receptor (MCP) glutamine deamidase CheD
MQATPREVSVASDRFEVVHDDAMLQAELRSAIAVCLYDAVEEAGALLHLRFILRGPTRSDVTDTTLATELLLLDRCIEALRQAAPAARNLQARIVAHVPEGATAMAACEAVLTLIGHFLSDAGASVSTPDVGIGTPRRLQFRPAMGRLSIR